MANLNHNPDLMRQVLEKARVIAVVGHSDRPQRTSYQIARFLEGAGYTVYPVNPTVESIDGRPSYASLADVPEQIDIVNVFRRSEHLPGIVEQAITAGAGVVWAQLGVWHEEARQRALEAGLHIAMDTCIKIDYLRLVDTRPDAHPDHRGD